MTHHKKPRHYGRGNGAGWVSCRWVLQHFVLPITLALIAHWPNLHKG